MATTEMNCLAGGGGGALNPTLIDERSTIGTGETYTVNVTQGKKYLFSYILKQASSQQTDVCSYTGADIIQTFVGQKTDSYITTGTRLYQVFFTATSSTVSITKNYTYAVCNSMVIQLD